MRRIALLHTFWFGILSMLVVLGLTIGLDQATHTVAGDIVALVYFVNACVMLRRNNFDPPCHFRSNVDNLQGSLFRVFCS